MDFSYSEEQQILQKSVSRFISKDYDFERRRAIIKTTKGYNEQHWALFAELGWLMLPFKEEDGGLGGSNVDLMVIMEEFGKGLVNEPFIPTAILAGGLISKVGNQAQKQDLLETLMAGELQLAFAYNEPQSRYNLADVACTAQEQDGNFVLNGHKCVVFNAGNADKIIVSARTSGQQTDKDGISLFIVDANSNGIKCVDYPTVDGHHAGDIWFDQVTIPKANLLGELNNAFPAIDYIIDRATLAICAEAVGALEVITNKTVEYAKTRQQFGREIGTFQALQHRMGTMFIESQQARSMLLMATLKMDSADGYDPKALSAAKSRIGAAARLVSQEAVQIHGGIGMTDELDVGHYFKRLSTFQYMFGSTDHHTQRYIAS